MAPVLAALAAVVAFVAAVFGAVRHLLSGRHEVPGGAVVHQPTDDTGIDASGAVRSVQSAEIAMPREALEELWDPLHLERLARTYWTFLSRCTLGMIKVRYTERERYVTLLIPQIKLLTFCAPEYEMDANRGIVRWRIQSGLLVAHQGRGADGHLEIDVKRLPTTESGKARISVQVTVASFYPSIATRLGRFVYTNTQSRVHVIVTYGFLRALARRDLDESIAGRFAGVEDVPNPASPTPVGG